MHVSRSSRSSRRRGRRSDVDGVVDPPLGEVGAKERQEPAGGAEDDPIGIGVRLGQNPRRVPHPEGLSHERARRVRGVERSRCDGVPNDRAPADQRDEVEEIFEVLDPQEGVFAEALTTSFYG